MPKSTPLLFPKSQRILVEVGTQLKLARLRRRLSSEQVAERAGMSRSTLVKIEKGNPAVSMGYYLSVLKVLGMEKDLLLLAKDDEFGRKLQDADLKTGERAPRRRKQQ